jgi:hypothetical protein
MSDLVRLADCPPGPFEFVTASGEYTLGFKTEYGCMTHAPAGWEVSNYPEVYCMESGEAFWGGTTTHDARCELMVRSVQVTVNDR